MLAQNACVLLVSDGLDREAGEGLGEEMERLAKSCRRLVWLNPLLRYDKFEARPAGVRAMLPHVDLFLPVHNLKSLVDLAQSAEQALDQTAGEPRMEMTGEQLIPASQQDTWDGAQRSGDAQGLRAGLRVDRPDRATTSTRC